MKKPTFFLGFTALIMLACNNQPADPVEKADSTNEARQDQAADVSQTKENTSAFLIKAADGGMAEVQAGKLGEEKATHNQVKKFAALMVEDHTAANNEIKALASKLNISLPQAPSEENMKKTADMGGKTAKDFDKDFMDMMVSDHKKTIDLFKDASDDNIDADVKAFINNTIPKLEEHLAKADSIHKTLK
jgi:putative membrane protein